ncbi:MAG TPA: ATP-binding protein [Chloroflexota bacterium]|nr:ATP-binding protein [Chloroflexota bacterium]
MRRLSLRARVLLACLLAPPLCAAVLVVLLLAASNHQAATAAQQRVLRDLPVVRAQLDAERQDQLKIAALVGLAPALAQAAATHNVSLLSKLVGPLRAQLAANAQVIAVVDVRGNLLAADPFTALPLATDAPVKAALAGSAQANGASSRNAALVVHNGYPALAEETAWPLRAQGKVVGAVVLLRQVSDQALATSLASSQLEAAVVAPNQRAVLAATPTLRRLNSQQRFPAALLSASSAPAPSAAKPSAEEVSLEGRSYVFARTALPSQPVPVQLMLGSPDSGAAGIRAGALVAVAALTAVILAGLEALLLLRLLVPLRRLEQSARRLVEHAPDRLAPGPGPTDVAAVQAGLAYLEDELAAAQEARRRERSRLEATMDSMAEGVVVSDLQRRVTYANPVAKRLLGLHGAAVREGLGGELVPLANGHASDRLVVNAQTLKTTSAAIIDQDGQSAGYVTVVRDAAQEAELDRLTSDFVGVVSHELRTPLTSIKGSVDLLLDADTGDLNTTQRRFLNTIRRSSDRLIDLVNDLLDLSRLEAGRLQLDCHPLDVTYLAQDTVNGLSNLFVQRKQIVHTELERDLPPVLADRQRLEQVLINLLGNASKYTPEQGSITVAAHRQENHVVIDVADSGPGLSTGEAQRVFEKFYRVGDSLTQQQQGSGLGLAIVRSLVELHGGEVSVQSEPGQGATFSIRLPVYENEE